MSISKALRAAIYERDGFMCRYCFADDVPLTLDPIIPRSRGGGDAEGNLVSCCRPCNSAKGAKTDSEWMGRPGSVHEYFRRRELGVSNG